MHPAVKERTPRLEHTPHPLRGTVHGRSDLIDAAARAAAKGLLQDAIAKYQEALPADGRDPATHVKIATLLVKLRQLGPARPHFEAAATQYVEQGFDEKAIGVYRAAVVVLPHDVSFWEGITRLHRDHGRTAEAIKTVLEACRKLGGRQRSDAIRLLHIAFQLEPWHQEATYALATLLAKEGGRDEARRLFEGLVERCHGWRLRRVRRALFSLGPTPGAAWRWLRAACIGH